MDEIFCFAVEIRNFRSSDDVDGESDIAKNCKRNKKNTFREKKSAKQIERFHNHKEYVAKRLIYKSDKSFYENCM